MPQLQLPMFPHGTTEINNHIGIQREGNQITYFYGHLPIFTHDVNDRETFRMITSQICVNGNATQSEIHKTFGVPKISIKRGVKICKEKGVSGFYEKRATRGPSVLTSKVILEAQKLLDTGSDLSEVAKEIEVKKDTLRKAVKAGKLHLPVKKK